LWELRRVAAAPEVLAMDEAAVSGAIVLVDLLPVEAAAKVAVPPPPSETAAWTAPGVLIALWLGAAALAGGWMLLGWWQTRRLLRSSRAAPAWIFEEFRQIATGAKRPAEDGRARLPPSHETSQKAGSAGASPSRKSGFWK